jgi:hypothetical protein
MQENLFLVSTALAFFRGYIILRWFLNCCIRFIAWCIYLGVLAMMIATVVGIVLIPFVWKYIRSTEDFLGKYFALNRDKFSSVKFLSGRWNSLSSDRNNEIDITDIIETEPENNSLDILINGILNITNTPDV